MNEPVRIGRYGKDASKEILLRRLNEVVGQVDSLTASAEQPELPVVFIIGPPQSATTLVSQLLSYSGGFGYVSNVAARFYAAPWVGLLVDQVLDTSGGGAGHCRSEYGVTDGWSEPHEFGYFWDRWFDQGQEVHKLGPELLEKVDSEGLRKSVARMEATTGNPMLFKNNTWCTMQVEFLHNLFPNAVWVVCQRHPLFIAQSIARGRLKRYGDYGHWWSIRPPRYASLLERPWWEQVAGQVHDIVSEMESGLECVPRDRVVRVRYDDLCARPGDMLDRVKSLMQKCGVSLEMRDQTVRLNCLDKRVLGDGEWSKLRRACLDVFGSEYEGWVI